MGLRFAYAGYVLAVVSLASWVNSNVPNPYMVAAHSLASP